MNALSRVLVIGCGFGGIEAVRALSKAAVEITLVDRTNHHLFQPLLYQVATAGLNAPARSRRSATCCAGEERGNLTMLKAEVRAIDVAARKRRRSTAASGSPRTTSSSPRARRTATSATTNGQRFAPGLKTLADAFEIRARVIGAFESAERASAPRERDAWLTFVVIGGGPTGVEMAGTMCEIAQHTLAREFRRIDPGRRA